MEKGGVQKARVEQLHGAKEHMPSFGGIEAPGSLGLTQAASAIVLECVSERGSSGNDMAWVSAREKMGHGPTQTGVLGRVTDGNSELREPDGIISGTAPAPRDSACEIRSVFCEPLKRGRLHDGKPVLKRSAPGTRPECGRLKWRQIEESSEFGKSMAPCEHVYEARRAARRERCSRDARSESRGRHGRARVRGRPHGAGRVRVTSTGIAQHEGQVGNARWFTWWMARERALDAINVVTLRPSRIGQTKGTKVL